MSESGHQPSPTPKPFHVETRVAAPPADVWPALTEPGRIRRWFGWDYDGIEAEITLIFVDEPKHEDGRRVTWSDGSYLEVEADGPHTVVRAVLPGDLTDARWDDVYDGIEEGWRAFLAQLRHLLETRPEGRRRTVFLTGSATGADLRAAAGDGTPVHESERQFGLVDPHGHLVVAASQARLAEDRAANVSVTVSTYGLDDDAFAAVRERWASRWLPVAADAAVTTGSEPVPPGLF